MGDEVVKEGRVMVGEAVLYHGQQVERRVREVVKPVSTPVDCKTPIYGVT